MDVVSGGQLVRLGENARECANSSGGVPPGVVGAVAGGDGSRRKAPETFASRTDAQTWLTLTKADIERNHWVDPDAGAVNFGAYAMKWIEERGLAPTTDELYRRLMRLHLLPTFGALDLDEITAPGVRTWRAEQPAPPRSPSPTGR